MNLMFCSNEILCAVYVRNIIPSHSLGRKTYYGMRYDHIPLVKNLKVFGSTCYALIRKEKRNKPGARIQKCIFLRYSNITKAYHLYIEVNKNLVFLKYTKNKNIVERHLDHLYRFNHVKEYHDFDKEIPHLEGGIPILDQSLESPSCRRFIHFIRT
jgi:hypothetical protein